jgi:ribosome assembly protein 3
MPTAKTATSTRKRNRKRKRRAASLSSSSESSDSTSSEADEQKQPTPKTVEVAVEASSSSSSSDSDSESGSDSGTDVESPVVTQQANKKHHNHLRPSTQGELRASESTVKQNIRATRASPSPSPPPTIIPSFLPSTNEDPTGLKTQELRERFRKFWMASVAEGFKDDLEQIQKVSVRLVRLAASDGDFFLVYRSRI